MTAPFSSFTGWADGQTLGEVEQVVGRDTKALVRFATADQQVIHLKVALSYVSVAQARLNLESELPHWDFDRVRRESQDVWNEWLSKIEVEGGTEAQRIKFYTDLWHVLLGRRLTSDVDGKYCDRTGPEPVIRQIPLGPDGRPRYHHFNSDAFWNTFWNINQVWGLSHPDIYRQFVSFLLDMYRDGGLIPRGPSGHNYTFVMIGAHSTPFHRRGLHERHPRLRCRDGLCRNAEERLSRRPDGPRPLRAQQRHRRRHRGLHPVRLHSLRRPAQRLER